MVVLVTPAVAKGGTMMWGWNLPTRCVPLGFAFMGWLCVACDSGPTSPGSPREEVTYCVDAEWDIFPGSFGRTERCDFDVGCVPSVLADYRNTCAFDVEIVTMFCWEWDGVRSIGCPWEVLGARPHERLERQSFSDRTADWEGRRIEVRHNLRACRGVPDGTLNCARPILDNPQYPSD